MWFLQLLELLVAELWAFLGCGSLRLKGLGSGARELVFNRHHVSVLQNEKVLEMVVIDGCTAT